MTRQASLETFHAAESFGDPAVVVNIARVKGKKPVKYDIYIGRQTRKHPQSLFYNHYKEGKDGGRHAICEKYRQWLLGEYEPERDQIRRTAILIRLSEMIGQPVVFGCWCKPLECHGDALVAIVNRDIPFPKTARNQVKAAMDRYFSGVVCGGGPIDHEVRA